MTDEPEKTPTADELVRTAYARETADASILYEGMSFADIAHVVSLIESKVIPAQAGGELLTTLLGMHPTRPLDFTLEPARGDLYSNREAYIQMFTPTTVGWLSTGRARREATTIGYRLAVRSRLLSLSYAIEKWLRRCIDCAGEHRATLFPDYTYLHPAQPTTFGHYLLTFVYPGLRDLTRMRVAFEHVNSSPAGSGSVNGSRLPLDRAGLAELLGFDSLIPHTRDAMWQADGPIEIGALIAALLVNVSRLAEDLQIFTTAEFDLIELDASHTRSSFIMPQKKNPYSLAYLRGVAGEAIGTLTAMAVVGRTPSGQIDNRMFAYGDVPRALDAATNALFLAAGVVRGLSVKKDVAGRRVRENFLGATDLADLVLTERGIDYRTAHRIVAKAVNAAQDRDRLDADLLDEAAEAVIGRKLELSPETIAKTLDPDAIVRTRTGPGGAAESSIDEMITSCRSKLKEHGDWRRQRESKIGESQSRLLEKAGPMKRQPQTEGPAPARKKLSLSDFEKEFEGLPKMPRGRRPWER